MHTDVDAGRRVDATRGRVMAVAVSVGLAVAYALWFAHVTGTTYRRYGYGTFDLAFSDQGVWLLSRFHAPYLTIVGRNLFGDHAQFSLVSLVPLYWLRPDATTLLDVQALALASGAVPVYLLAMRRLCSHAYAAFFVVVFLLYPALSRTNLENFHPDSFLVPLVGFLVYAAVENRPRLFVVCSVLALLCKEDVVLIVLPLAVWFALRRDRRVGIAVAAGSLAFSLFATNVVMRSLVGISTRNAARIPFSTCAGSCSVTRHVADFVKTCVTEPLTVLRYLRSHGRPFYVWELLAPTGLVLLLAPDLAAVVLLVLAANVFSTIAFQHSIAYHYSMVLIPVVVMGTIVAVSRLRTPAHRHAAVAIIALSALVSAYLWSALPLARHPATPTGVPAATAAAIEPVVEQLPPHAIVSAGDMFVPHLDHREQIYRWPTPFAASHWQLAKQEGQRLPFADNVEYLLLPPRLDERPDVLAAIQNEFTEVARAEDADGRGAVLYRRVATSRASAPR